MHACSEYFFSSGGKDITFLFDGFDEFPEHLQKGSLVMDIINHEALPLCGLVVSSRPHMSDKIRSQEALRVEILGFTEKEWKLFINQALPGQPKKIEDLTHYFDHHWTISSLCFVPFNMVVLLYLYEHGITLPKNFTELYNYFICYTINQNLNRSGYCLEKPITELAHLLGPVYKIIKQLSELSLEALNSNQLVFTLDKIKSVCPGIETVPEAINGFGLLQMVQHLDPQKTLTFNFVHFSIQEFLAAHYVAYHRPQEELQQLLLDKFWNNFYSNMFTMYIALTKGQQESFKFFLCGGNNAVTICELILDDQLKCLRLYRCFNEAEDFKACKAIESAKIFQQKTIDLRGNKLSASDVECVALFLTSSSRKEWTKLDLRTCYIGDHGLHVLHHWLCACNSNVTIGKLWLSKSGFTSSSSSFIREMATTCRVKELWIANNENIGEDEQFYSILTCSTATLETLNLDYTNL